MLPRMQRMLLIALLASAGTGLMAATVPATTPAAPVTCPACAAGDDHLGDDPWIAAGARAACPVAALAVTDQAGTVRRWGDLAGEPLVVAFIYSRCANPNKCPRTTAALGALARRAAAEGLRGVRFAIATYDPAYDTAERLAAWTRGQGVAPVLGVMLLRPGPGALAATVSGWQLAVNYQADGEVATHDIELLVCDRQLRLAHRYHATLWDQDAVVADIRRLLAEPAGPAGPDGPVLAHP